VDSSSAITIGRESCRPFLPLFLPLFVTGSSSVGFGRGACLCLGYLMVAQIVVYNAIIPTIRDPEIGMRLWIVGSQIIFATVVFYGVRKWWLPKRPLFSADPRIGANPGPS
jgi:hypothetical protein